LVSFLTRHPFQTPSLRSIRLNATALQHDIDLFLSNRNRIVILIAATAGARLDAVNRS
jgi:hypothetical protein